MRSDKTLSYKYLLLLAGGWVVLMLMGAAETAEAGTSWLQSVWQQIDFNLIQGDRYKMLLSGLGVTLRVSAVAALIGFVLGTVLALMRLSNFHIGKFYPLRAIASVYVDIIRGTPVVVQLVIMYYIILASCTNTDIVAFITFGLNSAAYVSEIIRGGILAVDKGQTEAARSLGLSSWQSMRLVVLPQAIKNVLPALANEVVTMVKESSICSVLGMAEIMYTAQTVSGNSYITLAPYVLAALVYFCINYPASKAIEAIERRMRRGDKQ